MLDREDIMKRILSGVLLLALFAAAGWAQNSPATLKGLGFEVNALWPFFPGGISEFRLIVPVLPGQGERQDGRGDLVVGLYSDFASRVVRSPEAGKVAYYALKLGYRQSLAYGLQLEPSVNLGWRSESEHLGDGTPFAGFISRFWLLGGYQHDFDERFYANFRSGFGLHLYRSDAFAAEERLFVPALDINLGVRF